MSVFERVVVSLALIACGVLFGMIAVACIQVGRTDWAVIVGLTYTMIVLLVLGEQERLMMGDAGSV